MARAGSTARPRGHCGRSNRQSSSEGRLRWSYGGFHGERTRESNRKTGLFIVTARGLSSTRNLSLPMAWSQRTERLSSSGRTRAPGTPGGQASTGSKGADHAQVPGPTEAPLPYRRVTEGHAPEGGRSGDRRSALPLAPPNKNPRRSGGKGAWDRSGRLILRWPLRRRHRRRAGLRPEDPSFRARPVRWWPRLPDCP